LKYLSENFFVPAAVLAVAACLAPASLSASGAKDAQSDMAGVFHLNEERGPLRHVDLAPFTGEVSSEVLAGPANGLDTAFIIYTRMAPGAKKKGLFSLPVDETYLVFSGKLNVQLGTDEFVAAPDTLVFVPAGVAHRVWNAGTEPEADMEVVTPATGRDLASMMKPAVATKVDNAAQYIRVAPPLGPLAGGVGHQGLNERVLADRATGSEHVLERLDDVPPAAGGPASHIHPFDQVYFVTKGTMTVQYGLAHYEAPENTLVILHMGTVHSNLNNGSTVESHVTLLLPEPPKGVALGAGVTISTGGGQGGRGQGGRGQQQPAAPATPAVPPNQ
jgi:mannose-6-phosphate isomerase-like protein (cupin superfamily)